MLLNTPIRIFPLLLLPQRCTNADKATKMRYLSDLSLTAILYQKRWKVVSSFPQAECLCEQITDPSSILLPCARLSKLYLSWPLCVLLLPLRNMIIHLFSVVALRQNRFRHFADHRVGWVIDIAEVIFHCLAHENVCAHRVDP